MGPQGICLLERRTSRRGLTGAEEDVMLGAGNGERLGNRFETLPVVHVQKLEHRRRFVGKDDH
jgi:hypothetical protein